VPLSDAEIDRYQRHLVLREVGGQGQQAFAAGRVAVVGAGGIGSPLLQYLVAAGVGHVTIVDDDRVALSNLQRQTLFATDEVGARKAAAAAARLRRLNPHVDVRPRGIRLSDANAAELLAGHDVIADGCDTFLTRAVVNRAAVALGIPLVSAAVGPFDGQLGVFAGHRADAPCWACFAGAAADVPGTSCADTGVLGAVVGVVGAAAALEVLRLLHPFGDPRIGTVWLFDALSMQGRSVRVGPDPGCPVCARVSAR
jgi:adenylyltransferase/sulfurtransferase